MSLDSTYARAQYGQPYVHSSWAHVGALLKRQVLLMKRNMLFVGFRMFSAIFMSIVFGGMYYQKPITDGLPRYGLFLNVLMNLAFTNMSEMANAVENKFVAYAFIPRVARLVCFCVFA